MFDGNFEIVRHTGRQSRCIRDAILSNPSCTVQPRERPLRIPVQRRDAPSTRSTARASASSTCAHNSSAAPGAARRRRRGTRSPSRLTCTRRRSGFSRCPSASVAVTARSSAATNRSCRPSGRYAPNAQASGLYCVESARPCASARSGNRREANYRDFATLPPPPARGIRRTRRQPSRDKIATSVAGKNLVIGSSSISPNCGRPFGGRREPRP